MSLLLAVLALVAAALAGAVLWSCVAGMPRTVEEVIEAVLLGLAASFVLLTVAARVELGLFTGFAAMLLAAGVLLLVRALRAGMPRPGRDGRVVLAIVFAYEAVRAVPLILNPHPLGWDPYFHLVLAERIATTGRIIADWQPFEAMPLNYPIGSHLLTAWIARLAGAPLPGVFGMLTGAFTLMNGLAALALVSRATADRLVGVLACATYLAWANLGGLDYARWGGLPNAAAMALFLAALSLTMRKGLSTRLAAGGIALLLGAIVLVHHHAAVTAAAACSVSWLFACMRRDRETARRLGWGLIGSLIIAGPSVASYLLKTRHLAESGLGTYSEAVLGPLRVAREVGIPFTLLVVLGATWLLLRRRRGHDVSSGLDPTYLVALGTLLACFVGVDWGIRFAMRALADRDFTPFTPSRFLGDSIVLLAVFPALLLRAVPGTARRRAVVVGGLLVLGALPNVPAWRALARDPVPPARLAAYSWIRDYAAPDALVIDPYTCATYFTQRTSNGMPIPSSEFWSFATRREAARAIAGGRLDPREAGVQVLVVDDAEHAVGGHVRWSQRGGPSIVEVAPDPASRAANAP